MSQALQVLIGYWVALGAVESGLLVRWWLTKHFCVPVAKPLEVQVSVWLGTQHRYTQMVDATPYLSS